MTCVLFDLDGTLADTSGDLLAAANACFEELGYGPLLTSQDKSTSLKGGRAMLTLGLQRVGVEDEVLITSLYPKLLDAYEGALNVHTQFYDGALEAIEVLKSKGYKIGIATNKPDYLAQKLIKDLDVCDYFDVVIGSGTHIPHKPNPEHLFETIKQLGSTKQRSVLIGDTHTDFNAAKNADIPCILVDFGDNLEEIKRLQPTYTFSHYNDLPRLIQTIFKSLP